MKPYRLQLVQALKLSDKAKQMEFSVAMLQMKNNTASQIIFSDEATFHIYGHFNHHNVRIWETEHPCETV